MFPKFVGQDFFDPRLEATMRTKVRGKETDCVGVCCSIRQLVNALVNVS